MHLTNLDLIINLLEGNKQVIIFNPNHIEFGPGDVPPTIYTYAETWDLIQSKTNFITLQMGLLDTCWDYGYDVYIINNSRVPVLISNETLDIPKELRHEHNLFKLWRSGGLGEQFDPSSARKQLFDAIKNTIESDNLESLEK